MTDEIDIDLEAASLTIDMIAMLKVKTKGNISDEESKIIDQSINELRMNFIASKDNNNKSDQETKDDKNEENK